MVEYTRTYGGLAENQHLAEELEFPIVDSLDGIPKGRQAIDTAATQRRGILLIGPQGSGKSEGMRQGLDWFTDFEKQKYEKDNSYRRRKILRIRGPRDASYRDTGVFMAKKLSRRYSDRVRGKKKENNEIREDLMQLCLKTHHVVLILDEAEKCSNDSLAFFRDLVADAQEEDDGATGANGGRKQVGIGLVLTGTPDLEQRIIRNREAGQRWAGSIHTELPDIDDLIVLYHAWFPAFAPHVEEVGKAAWKNYLSSLIMRGEDGVSLHLIRNQAVQYVLTTARLFGTVKDVKSIPFKRELFEAALEEADWARNGRTRGGAS